jgi:hypothetical protein
MPLNKRRVMFSEGNAAHLVGCNPAADTVVMSPLGVLFLNLNLLGWVWQPHADYTGCLARFK